jgi:hypothetical protein
MSGGDAVVDMPPMIGCGVARIDASGIHSVDVAEHLGDLWPALDAEQDVAARLHEWQRRERFACANRTYDVDARTDGAIVIGPKMAPGRKLTIRRRRSTISSFAIRPKRIQCSTRFSIHVS